MKDYSAAFVNTNGVAFPGTAGKNATGPSATDGTEFIKEFIDDLWGFNQALLYTAGATPDGNAEVYNASQRMEALKTLFWPENHINGLVVTPNAIDPTHDIDISVGRAMDSTNSYIMRLESGFTKQLDAIWAAGSGVGGFYVGGGLPVSSTIYVYLIRKDSDGSIDVYADISANAANIPAGYTAYREIDRIRTDSGGLILVYSSYEVGNDVYHEYKLPQYDATTVATTAVRSLLTLTAPENTIAEIITRMDYVSAAVALWVSSTSATDRTPSTAHDQNATSGVVNSHVRREIRVDNNRQIAYRGNGAGCTFGVQTLGYTTLRG